MDSLEYVQMIKPEELMIGNLVMYEQTTHIVTEIRKDTVCSRWINQSLEELDYECSFEELKPILITEEIIKKFGFQWKNHGLRKDNFVIREYGDGFAVFLSMESFNFKIDIEYVHQLQNLYFNLTNRSFSKV